MPTNNTTLRIRAVWLIVLLLTVLFCAFCCGLVWRRGRQQQLNRALFKAVEQANLARVGILLGAGADPNVREHPASQPRSPIQWIKLMIGRTPNTETGSTALMTAAFQGEEKIVRLLLTAGADVNAADQEEDGSWETPLLDALYSESPRKSTIVEMLLNDGANPNQDLPDHSQLSVLQQAADHDPANIVATLLAHRARFDPHSEDGRNLVSQYAVHNSDANVLACFLNKGIDPNMQDANGQSLLMLAQTNLAVDQLLLARGAKVNFRDKYESGATALTLAETARYRARKWAKDRKTWDAVITLLKAHGGNR